MPLYEYICTDCGHPFEKMVRFSDTNPEIVCPQCNSQETRKRLSLVGFSSSSGSVTSSSSCGTSSRGFT